MQYNDRNSDWFAPRGGQSVSQSVGYISLRYYYYYYGCGCGGDSVLGHVESLRYMYPGSIFLSFSSLHIHSFKLRDILVYCMQHLCFAGEGEVYIHGNLLYRKPQGQQTGASSCPISELDFE